MPPPPPPHHYDLLTPLVSAAVAFILVLITAMVIIYRKITRKKAVLLPTESPTKQPLQRFSQSLLSRATGGFSAANRIGQGGFGSVYKGVLPSGQEVAVKLMNNASIQGEREFHNEISLVSSANIVSCPHIVSLLGFATWDCDKDWNLRWIRDRSWMFFSCFHGGAKDDNKSVTISGKKLALVYEYMQNGSLQDGLLDGKCVELNCWKKRFNVIMCVAKGLEYLHSCCDPPIIHGDVKPSNVLLDSNFNAKIADFGLAQKLGKVDEETAGIFVEEDEKIGDDYVNVEIDDHVVINVDQSPEKKTVASSRSEVLERSSSVLELGVFEEKRKCDLERDWWCKQENVKGYVMEWINKDSSPKKDWIRNLGSIDNPTKKKKKKKLEWWASLDREALRSKADRKPREWWKEEFCDELSKKKKKRGGLEDQHERKKKQSRTSIDRSIDSIGSTPSMRGTICYIAPECGTTQPSDKCDVYSFGVLLLVVVSGRRPLQVTASPLSEFERANLISWARQLALSGRLMDLVDPNIRSLERERAFLCVTVALLCLQRSPGKRPAMREVVGMLSGKCEIPNLPFEFSPSPPSNFPFKTRRRSQ